MTIEEYLKEIELTEEEYDMFTKTWIGIDKLRGILDGKIDDGTLLGHAVGASHVLQGCIVSIITNEHNIKHKKEHDSKSDKGQQQKG